MNINEHHFRHLFPKKQLLFQFLDLFLCFLFENKEFLKLELSKRRETSIDGNCSIL
jgi:hypothetical protein